MNHWSLADFRISCSVTLVGIYTFAAAPELRATLSECANQGGRLHLRAGDQLSKPLLFLHDRFKG